MFNSPRIATERNLGVCLFLRDQLYSAHLMASTNIREQIVVKND